MCHISWQIMMIKVNNLLEAGGGCMGYKTVCMRAALMLSLASFVPSLVLAMPSLSLSEAERIARIDDPATQRFQELAEARREAAISASQLPDPMLIVEVMDVARDGFTVEDDSMTQLRLGIRQTFPRGDSRRFASERESAMAQAEEARSSNAERAAMRAVRRAYLSLHNQRAVLEVLKQSQPLFEDLREITEREFASGFADQQDLLRAELELDRLHDRLLNTQAQESAALAQLSRWVGLDAVARPLPSDFPELAEPTGTLLAHPLLAAEQAIVDAGAHGIELSRQGYKPQWSVELTYGTPTERGMGMPDRMSAMVMVDLPLFTRQRQDRDLSASVHQREAAQYAWHEQVREMQRQLDETQARWRQLSERERGFVERLIPQAKANAEAAEHGYRNRTVDFTAYVRARLIELDTQIDAIGIATERRLEQVDLLYLLGEDA
ncbi:TolC family protein [Billgrantia montanilacus]|uniref:TolC family protein n=2 Tax=Billgrantia montanilacus TaxID=2282305 RepID=A0A368TY30_9GAMM|nr:TolC family protein [Halomonas montanilacus]